MYNKGNELLKLCSEQNKKISEIVIEKKWRKVDYPMKN